MKKFARVSSMEATLPFSVDGSSYFVNDVLTNSFWNAYVIGDVSADNEQSATDDDVLIIESDTPTYSIPHRTIEADSRRTISSIKFIAYLLEQERQNKGIYTVHGNVISLGTRAIACVGGISGIGKTTLSSKAHTHGWEWTSDEKFLMDSSGHYVRGLASIQDDAKSSRAADGLRPVSPQEQRDIAGFVIPIVADQPLSVHSYETAKAEYHLYEEMGRNITAGRAILQGYDTPLPSLDTDSIARRRYACARELAQRVPMYFMIGEASAILAQCESIISE